MLIVDEIRQILRSLVEVISSALRQFKDGVRRLVEGFTEISWYLLLLLTPALISFALFGYRRDLLDLSLGVAYLVLLAVLLLLNGMFKSAKAENTEKKASGEQILVVIAGLLITGFVVFRALHFVSTMTDLWSNDGRSVGDDIRHGASAAADIGKDVNSKATSGATSGSATGVTTDAGGGQGCAGVLVEPVTDGGVVTIHFPLSCPNWPIPAGMGTCVDDAHQAVTWTFPAGKGQGPTERQTTTAGLAAKVTSEWSYPVEGRQPFALVIEDSQIRWNAVTRYPADFWPYQKGVVTVTCTKQMQ